MKFSTIERNPDTKQLEAVFSFNDRITITVPINNQELVFEMIKNAVEDPIKANALFINFLDHFRDLETYTKYRRKIMSNMDIINSNAVFRLVAAGSLLTMNEIYWFDWFCDKHGLIGRDYE